MAFAHERQVFLTLWLIRMPVGAVTSILHRIPLGYAEQPTRPLLVGTGRVDPEVRQHELRVCKRRTTHWRALLIDVDVGSRLPAPRRSAWFVNLAALFLALLMAWILR